MVAKKKDKNGAICSWQKQQILHFFPKSFFIFPFLLDSPFSFPPSSASGVQSWDKLGNFFFDFWVSFSTPLLVLSFPRECQGYRPKRKSGITQKKDSSLTNNPRRIYLCSLQFFSVCIYTNYFQFFPFIFFSHV